MGNNFPKIGRQIVVWITGSIYSLFFWLNINVIFQIDNQLLKYIYIILLNLQFCMLIWTFVVIIITDPGLPQKDDGQSPFSRKPYCNTCKVIKPERCHHCSICDRCVLQMDHHCPWINTCVGYKNRKQFILLLFYALCFNITTIIGTSNSYLINFTISLLNLFYAISCLGNYLLVFLLSGFLKYHIELLTHNLTTLEDIINQRHHILFNIYDINVNENIQQLFGKNKMIWLFPIYSGEGCEDGCLFPHRNDCKLSTFEAPPPQVTQIIMQQQQQQQQQQQDEHPFVNKLYQQEKEKKQINQIIKI